MAMDVTLDRLKVLAHQSKSELAGEGLNLGHKQCLDLQARIHGFQNYETAKALLGQAKEPQAPASETGHAREAAKPSFTLEQLPALPREILTHAANPPTRMRAGARLSANEELERATAQGAGKEVLDYLMKSPRGRTGGTDAMAYLMLGWELPDTGDKPWLEELTCAAEFAIARKIMQWPEARGREAELARLGDRWPELAANWHALCQIQDQEKADGMGTARTGPSLGALALRSLVRTSDVTAASMRTEMERVRQAYPDQDWTGWLPSLYAVRGLFTASGPGKTSEEDIVQPPTGHGFTTVLKFGEPCRLCVVRHT